MAVTLPLVLILIDFYFENDTLNFKLFIKKIWKFGIHKIIFFVIALGFGIFMMEPPSQARYRKVDERTLEKIDGLHNNIGYYYKDTKQLPKDIEKVQENHDYYFYAKDFNTIDKDHKVKYTILAENEYELCADFYLDSETIKKYSNHYLSSQYEHDKGYKCFNFNVLNDDAMEQYPIR
jgi:hypothetical protein